MSYNVPKYDFRFNRDEAQVMLEVLEYWKKNFTSGLENSFDSKERNENEEGLKITKKLIQKIVCQINTKKKVLNFIIVQYTLLHLSSFLKVNTYENKLAEAKDQTEIKTLQGKIEICKTLIKRIGELPYIGEPHILIQIRKADDSRFNNN